MFEHILIYKIVK